MIVLTPRSGAGYFILATIHVHGEPNVFDASVQADSIQFHACGAARGAVRSRTRGQLQQRRGRQGGRRCGDSGLECETCRVSVCLHVSQHGCVVNAYVYGSTVYAPCIGVTCVGKGVYPCYVTILRLCQSKGGAVRRTIAWSVYGGL